MRLRIIIFLYILTISVGLYDHATYALGSDVQEADPIQDLLDMPEEIKWQILENLLPPVKRKLIDHIRLLKQNKPRAVKKLITGSVSSVAFSPDGKVLVSGSGDCTIKLWDVDTGTEIRTLRGHGCRVGSVTFSPDGKVLASVSNDCTIKLWDVETGTKVKTLRDHEYCVYSVAFSPNGKVLASGSDDRTIKLWNVDTGTEIKTLSGHGAWVYSVDFSLDGKVLASGSGDGTIKLWDVGTGTEIKTLPNDEAYHMISVAFSPDGKIVASGSDSTIKLWDVNTGTEIKTLGHRWFVGSVEFSPDGKVLASGLCDGIKLWDVDSGTEIRTFPYYGSSLAFSPNGKVLASQIGDEDVILCHLYDEEDEEALEILGDSHYKLNLNQKMLLYVLHVNKKAAEKENPVKCKVKLQETEEEMKAGFADKPVPSMLNLAESYRSLPESLRKVVKDYFKVIE